MATTAKTDFMARLLKLSGCQDDLVQFLVDEKLMKDSDVVGMKNEPDVSKFLSNWIENLKKEEKLMLVDYEWIILPIERLKLTLVTERDKREFVYNF